MVRVEGASQKTLIGVAAAALILTLGCVVAVGLALVGGAVAVDSQVQEELRRAQIQTTRLSLLKLNTKVLEYQAFQLPTALPETLDDLLKPPNGEPPYVRPEELQDVWGERFVYDKEGDKYRLLSKGPDKARGTEDDIEERLD